MKRLSATLCLLHLVALLVLWGLIQSSFNSHWAVTLFLFSPRWVVALPLAILVPMTLMFRWRWAWIYLVHTMVILFPILGLQIGKSSIQDLDGDVVNGQVLRVLTCNTGGGDLSQEMMVSLVEDHRIDVLLLQECERPIAKSLFAKLGWNYRHKHQIAIGSSSDLNEATVLTAQSEERYRVPVAVGCSLAWPTKEDAGVELVSIHLPTFRPAFEKLRAMNMAEGAVALEAEGRRYDQLTGQTSALLREVGVPLVAAGDFNAPVESSHYRDFWTEFVNAFAVRGSGFGHTKFTRFHGVRIDHVLVNEAWSVQSCRVGPDLGGDHRPVLVELVLREDTDEG